MELLLISLGQIIFMLISKMRKKKILVILGATSTGKTDLGIYLAKKYNGELIACDSRQVYIGLDIGTGKLPTQISRMKKNKKHWEINGVKIWMYDIADPKFQYTLFDYVKDANKVIADVLSKNKLPIIVGGTGLYLRGLLEGFPNLSIPVNLSLRKKLEEFSLRKLQEKLKKLSSKRWNSLNDSDRKNKRRLLRSIEIITMNPYVRKNQKLNLKTNDILKIGLTAPVSILRERSRMRLIDRFNQGMLEETKSLMERGIINIKRMKELGLEYAMMAQYFQGKMNMEELTEVLSIKIGQYAKRQLTWFKKEKNVNWFDITDQNCLSKVERLINVWYHQIQYADKD